MDLKANATRLFDLTVGFGVINRLIAVDRETDAFALRANLVFVPIVAPQNLAQLIEVRLGEHLLAPRFVVQGAPVILAHIGLITDHFAVVGNAFGAELNAGVGFRRIAEEFELHMQDEIAVLLSRTQEFVARDFVFHRSGNDCAIFDAEETQIPFPAFESLAVKEPRGAALIGGCKTDDADDRENNGRQETKHPAKTMEYKHLRRGVSAPGAYGFFCSSSPMSVHHFLPVPPISMDGGRGRISGNFFACP